MSDDNEDDQEGCWWAGFDTADGDISLQLSSKRPNQNLVCPLNRTITRDEGHFIVFKSKKAAMSVYGEYPYIARVVPGTIVDEGKWFISKDYTPSYYRTRRLTRIEPVVMLEPPKDDPEVDEATWVGGHGMRACMRGHASTLKALCKRHKSALTPLFIKAFLVITRQRGRSDMTAWIEDNLVR